MGVFYYILSIKVHFTSFYCSVFCETHHIIFRITWGAPMRLMWDSLGTHFFSISVLKS